MKRQWYIEIPPYPKGKKRQPTPSPTSTELAFSSPRKKLKGISDVGSTDAQSGLPTSPTVSDFEVLSWAMDVTIARPHAFQQAAKTHQFGQSTNGLPVSPTVSDFAVLDNSLVDLTHSPSDEEEVPRFRPHFTKSLSTLVASGSNVTLEGTPVTLNDPEGSQRYDPYEAADDEISEDEDLIIPGETLLDGSEDDASVPVRLLHDFTIYDASSNVLVPIVELLWLKFSQRKFRASGLAKPWIDEDEEGEIDLEEEEEGGEEEEGNDVERIKLDIILEFDVHSFSDATGTLDSNIYIRTKFAWYILDMPSDQYTPLFVPFWTQHRILHLIITAAIKTPRMSYDEFLQTLEGDKEANDDEGSVDVASDDVLASVRMLGRTLSELDVQSDDVKTYVIGFLPDVCQAHRISFHRVPLLRSYLGSEALDACAGNSTSPRKSKRKASRAKVKRRIINKEQEVLKHRNTTVVTPTVSGIAKHLFKSSLEVAGSFTIDDAEIAAKIDNIQAHHTDPKSMKWGLEEPEGGKYYGSVIMDGVEYRVGDSVMVSPGADGDAIRARNARTDAAQSPNSYANRLWFCKICYFYEERVDGKLIKKFHGQWYEHGSKTILQETAHSKSLFLLFECANNPIASIFTKCKVTLLGNEETEIPDDAQPNANDFHCSLAYNEKKHEFVDIPDQEEIDRRLQSLPSYKPCVSCWVQNQEKALKKFTTNDDGFSHYGIDYHCYEFIYVRPETMSRLLHIAQIVKIDKTGHNSGAPRVTVRFFGRHDQYEHDEKVKHKGVQGSSGLASDERRLFRRTGKQTLENLELIDGVCYVRLLTDAEEIDKWVRHDDHFYVNQEEVRDDDKLHDMKGTLERCDACHRARVAKLKRDKRLLSKNNPITCLELFSGAGGLGTGMDMSGFVETKYAVEFSPSAAATYQANHPDTTVYCQDSSLLLKHAIDTDAGKQPEALISNDGKTRLPPMPRRNCIDIITGGPPCQSFSRANHNPRADDIRSTLPGNMLSYVEYYNPQYFLLENVAGLLKHPLMSTHSKNGRSLEGGIASGMVKFIMRSLIALGYQVRCKLLQAGQYGAPQSRRRVIFWGAKRGIPIPDFPVPVYAVPKGMHRTKLPTGDYMYPVSRSLDPGNYHQCAPLRPITVDDAIGDLPPFDWINPHDIIPARAHDKQEVKRRIQLGIPQHRAFVEDRQSIDLPGFSDGVEYATQPMNRYQKWLRQDMEDMEVEGHYTKAFTSKVVEATTTVPLRPLADHRDLPLALRPNQAKPGAKQAKKSFYGRMDGSSQFKCAMTRVAPNIKQSWLLHPSQKRIVSVRECARAQGFPDHYIFKSVDESPQKLVENQIRQIGNAVPVPLALHLGKALGKALLEKWAIDEREGSPAV
ncbi:C5-DNA-methyltransferase [Lyophyllum atratum]|nr:C5-DNA-methyltransferase [Lyophyllum atratum]